MYKCLSEHKQWQAKEKRQIKQYDITAAAAAVARKGENLQTPIKL